MVLLAIVKNSSATAKNSQCAHRMTRSGGFVGVVGNTSTPELRDQADTRLRSREAGELRPRTCGALRAMECIERRRCRDDVGRRFARIDGADLDGPG